MKINTWSSFSDAITQAFRSTKIQELTFEKLQLKTEKYVKYLFI